MSEQNMIRKIDTGLGEVLEAIGSDIRRRVRDMDGLGLLRGRADGDVTHDFDAYSERMILRYLETTGVGFRFSSEESRPVDIGTHQDFTIVVDPLDGSHLLARGYPLASVAVCVLRSEDGTPVLSRILEVFTKAHYAVTPGGTATRNGRPVVPAATTSFTGSFAVTYSATSARMSSHAFHCLCEHPPWLTLNYGGPLDIAKVGSGQCDMMLELDKGFPPWDYVAGLHFAQAAGAAAAQPDGTPVPYLVGDDKRVRFIVAANPALLTSALETFISLDEL